MIGASEMSDVTEFRQKMFSGLQIKIQFDLEAVCPSVVVKRVFAEPLCLTLIRCCSGGRKSLQQSSAAAGTLRQVAWKRPGEYESPYQGE